jgi:hypothetical protein
MRGVPEARHIAERAIAPSVRDDVHRLLLDHQRTAERVSDLEHQLAEAVSRLNQSIERIDQFEQHLPTILNSISSTNGTARVLMREVGELQALFAAQREEIIEPKVLNQAALQRDELFLNIDAGHTTIGGYINIGRGEFPGIDVVASMDAMPFDPGSITEIFSSHVLQHFAELELRRKLLPYWYSLLKVGGTFRAVVPDLAAMTEAFARGEVDFASLRSVVFGGQGAGADLHLTGFTPDSLSELLAESGFRDIRIVAAARRNDNCFEAEIAATRPV